MGGYPPGSTNFYQHARAGYEVRNLLASANILGQEGQQQTCEAVLATTRGVYGRYAADLHGGRMSLTDGPDWQRTQIAWGNRCQEKPLSVRTRHLRHTTRPSHRASAETVIPGPRHKTNTTPKVLVTNKSRCEKAFGKLSTSTRGRAPRNPPHVSTTLHGQGIFSRVLRSNPDTPKITNPRHAVTTR